MVHPPVEERPAVPGQGQGDVLPDGVPSGPRRKLVLQRVVEIVGRHAGKLLAQDEVVPEIQKSGAEHRGGSGEEPETEREENLV